MMRLIIWLRRGEYVLETKRPEQGASLDAQERLYHVHFGTCWRVCRKEGLWLALETVRTEF